MHFNLKSEGPDSLKIYYFPPESLLKLTLKKKETKLLKY